MKTFTLTLTLLFISLLCAFGDGQTPLINPAGFAPVSINTTYYTNPLTASGTGATPVLLTIATTYTWAGAFVWTNSAGTNVSGALTNGAGGIAAYDTNLQVWVVFTNAAQSMTNGGEAFIGGQYPTNAYTFQPRYSTNTMLYVGSIATAPTVLTNSPWSWAATYPYTNSSGVSSTGAYTNGAGGIDAFDTNLVKWLAFTNGASDLTSGNWVFQGGLTPRSPYTANTGSGSFGLIYTNGTFTLVDATNNLVVTNLSSSVNVNPWLGGTLSPGNLVTNNLLGGSPCTNMFLYGHDRAFFLGLILSGATGASYSNICTINLTQATGTNAVIPTYSAYDYNGWTNSNSGAGDRVELIATSNSITVRFGTTVTTAGASLGLAIHVDQPTP